MEGNEAPKPTILTAGNKELMQKATELAKLTREEGIGCLTGKFPVKTTADTGALPFDYAGEFFQGEKESGGLIPPTTPIYLMQRDGLKHRQVWSVSEYTPPMTEKPVEEVVKRKEKRFGILPKTHTEIRRRWVKTDIPKTYKGKKGESDWVRFGYYMPILCEYDGRPGIYIDMSVAVPPAIASQIEEQVAKNVYFPNAFFKSLYPEYIGTDTDRHIKIIPANELEIVDLRKGKNKSEVRPYPQSLQ